VELGQSFVSSYERSLDSKSRVILPTRLRTDFVPQGYLAPGSDGCIAFWTEDEFQAESKRQHEQETLGRDARIRVRKWFSRVFPFQADAQGRVAIPQVLVDFAQLDGDVVFVGVYDRLELWSKGLWDALDAGTLGDAAFGRDADGGPDADGGLGAGGAPGGGGS
jgi:MraZ protein